MPGTDPVQQLVHDLVLEPVADLAADTGGTHPALLPKDPKCLRDRIFGPSECGRQVADTDPRCPVQAQQDLEPVGILQQVEAQGPARGVDIGQRR